MFSTQILISTPHTVQLLVTLEKLENLLESLRVSNRN